MKNGHQDRNFALILLGFIAALTVIAIVVIRPPAPVGSDAPLNQFSSARAMEHLARIGTEPTPIGSVQHRQVREYLVSQLEQLGLGTEIHETIIYNPGWQNAGAVANIIARIPGTDNSQAVALFAHYDTVHLVPGAGSTKVGIAAILELLRVLNMGEPLKNDLIVVFADGGESGMLGSLAFLEQHPWAEDIGLVITADSRGTKGPVMLIDSGRSNSWTIPEFAKAVDNPIANSFTHEVNRLLVNYTDFLVFKQKRIPGFQLAFLDNPRAYKTQLDNLDQLDQRSLQHVGTYLYQLVDHFGNMEIEEQEENLRANQVYFDVFGRFLIRYPIGLVAHMLTIVIILFGFVCWHAVKAEKAKVTHVAFGVLLFAGMAVFSMLLSGIYFRFVQPSQDFYQYIPLAGGLWYYAALAALVSALFFLLYNWALDKYRLMDLFLGIQVVWLLITVIVSLFLPGASYAFIWPQSFSLVVVLALIRLDKLPWAVNLAVLAIGALPILLLWPYLLRTLYLIVGYIVPGLSVLLVVLALGALLPQWARIGKWQKFVLPILAAVTAAACLGMGIWSSQTSAGNPRMDTLFYFVDLDRDQAYWISTDPKPDQFTEQVFGGEYEESNLGNFIPYENMPVIYREAALDHNDVENPVKLELINDQNDGEVRRLTVNIQAASELYSMIVYIEPELLADAAALNGTALEWGESWPALRFYNLDADGITLTIPTAADQPFTMKVLAQKLQLPKAGLLPRPEDIIAAPTELTDSAFTLKSYQF